MRINIDDLPPEYQRQVQDKLQGETQRRNIVVVPISAIGKPRMTRADKWKKRDCVMRYRAYSDVIKEAFKDVDLTGITGISWDAYIEMPKSWSNKKFLAMRGQIHQQKPDRDNIDKGILDSLFADDSHIATGTLRKFWEDGRGERIEITLKYGA